MSFGKLSLCFCDTGPLNVLQLIYIMSSFLVDRSYQIFNPTLFQNGLMAFGIFPIMLEKTIRGTNWNVSAHPDKINCNWKISLTAKRHFRRWWVSHHLQVWLTGSFRLLPFSIQADMESLWCISVCASEWIYNISRKHKKKKKKEVTK